MDVVRNRVPPRVLTGIKPTGTPHIGNLLGAIRPALELANQGLDAMYFIADYHALTTVKDAKELRQLTYEVAATWLAAGLDPNRTLFYRQSDIPEIFELTWVFECFTPTKRSSPSVRRRAKPTSMPTSTWASTAIRS
jgi:tryptophanyl-tRNA synthetase